MVQTRYGRVVKKPERFSPQETVIDDYSSDEHDTDWESDISSEISYDPDELNEESETEDHDFIDDDEDEEELKKEPTEDDNGCDDDTASETSESDASGSGGGTTDDAAACV